MARLLASCFSTLVKMREGEMLRFCQSLLVTARAILTGMVLVALGSVPSNLLIAANLRHLAAR